MDVPTEEEVMKKTLFAFVAGIPLMIAGCGGNLGDLGGSEGTSPAENEAMAVALIGSGGESVVGDVEGSEGVTGQAQADMNAKILESVALKVEERLNEEMESEEFRNEILNAEDEASVSKDISVGFGLKGLSVYIEDEEVPFAGGTMMLNGEMGLRLRYLGGGELALEADGELLSDLDGVERAGYIREIPYYLSLDGTNYMGMEGSFRIKIKRWRVKSMSADFTASIISSDVTATGSIADKSVVGTVDLVDMSINLSNDNLLTDAKNFDVTCTGSIETSVNDEVLAACTVDPSCKSCK